MKIAIDLGHGVGRDRGAAANMQEEEIINAVGNLVIQGLTKLGYQVLNVRPTKQSMTVSESLSYRTNASNKFGADLYVSIHANAGGGQGSEVFTYRGNKITEAVNVLNNLVNLGFANRGIKDGTGLYVINHTVAKAMLIEICFVDSSVDVNKYNNIGALSIANAIIKGITGTSVIIHETDTKVVKDSWLKRLQREINNQGFGRVLVDGIAGPDTLSHCPTLKVNSRGNITKLIQEKLGIGADGIFGNITKNAVIAFQGRYNLIRDGIVGNNTWRKLLGL